MKLKKISIIIVFLLLCSGCSITKDSILSFFTKRTPVGSTPEALYSRGTADYQDGSYKKAREVYTRLKEEYPLHELAILAELGIADSFYSDKDYVEAEVAYGEFTTMYPTNENVPYAIYQTGMCHFVQIGAVDRDQTETIKAKREFGKLIARFPQSKFSLLAEKMIRECKKILGEQEFYVGEFYFNSKQYRAALRRFEKVARDYPNVGLDYKVSYYLIETKRRLAESGSGPEKKPEVRGETSTAPAVRNR